MWHRKDVGIVVAILLLPVSLLLAWLWQKWWLWRFMRRLKTKGSMPDKPSGLIPESFYVVQISEANVSCRGPKGTIESVEWDDLESVEVITTDEGPFLPDSFWFLNGLKTGCVIPWGATGETELLHRLQKLPGFQNEALIRAATTTDNARILCWKKETNSSS
jgi:hypothetical protein